MVIVMLKVELMPMAMQMVMDMLMEMIMVTQMMYDDVDENENTLEDHESESFHECDRLDLEDTAQAKRTLLRGRH